MMQRMCDALKFLCLWRWAGNRLVALCLVWGSCSVWADHLDLEASKDYLVGASLALGDAHFSDAGAHLSLRPLFAFRLGRLRVASGRASALLALGRAPVEAGVSAALISGEKGSLSTALRHDQGRPEVEGIAGTDLPGTLRGRVTVGYSLSDRWSVGASASQDLLGKGGGLSGSTQIRYRYPVSEKTYWEASLGAAGGNRVYMQGRYGVGAVSGVSPYTLSAGWDGIQLGWGYTSALDTHWVAFVSANASVLTGVAASSPLVQRPNSFVFTAGLAYRCCH